jgi:hypothetical protein
VCAIFGFGCREATSPYPARAAVRRAEPERTRLDFYSPEEIEALARALADGYHRDSNGTAVGGPRPPPERARTARTPNWCV